MAQQCWIKDAIKLQKQNTLVINKPAHRLKAKKRQILTATQTLKFAGANYCKFITF